MPVTRYPKELRLRVPGGLPDALERAADQHHQTPAEWARQALLRSLQAEGVSIRDGLAVRSVSQEASKET
jgi:plasmid stability protein